MNRQRAVRRGTGIWYNLKSAFAVPFTRISAIFPYAASSSGSIGEFATLFRCSLNTRAGESVTDAQYRAMAAGEVGGRRTERCFCQRTMGFAKPNFWRYMRFAGGLRCVSYVRLNIIFQRS